MGAVGGHLVRPAKEDRVYVRRASPALAYRKRQRTLRTSLADSRSWKLHNLVLFVLSLYHTGIQCKRKKKRKRWKLVCSNETVRHISGARKDLRQIR